MLVEPVICSCTVGHITACDSRLDTGILLCTQTSWAQVGSHRKQFPSLCTAHFAPVLCRLPHLHGSGAGIHRVAMASAQEVEMLRRQLDELTAHMIEVRQQSSSTAMNAAVSGLAEAVRTMGQSESKPRQEDMRVGKPEPYAPGKDFDDRDFTFNGYAGTLDLAYLALLKTARQSPTVVMATPPHEQQSATLL